MQAHANSKQSGAHRGAATDLVSRAIAAAARRPWLKLDYLTLEIGHIALHGSTM